jgi:hypothetical protein
VVIVRTVPWWGVVSAAAAPALMAGGWTVAAGLQPRPYNSVAGTVSALAMPGAADRWVMTLTFVVVGVCDVVTGLALRPARVPGRLILIAGGVAGVLVAANPEQPGTNFPLPHMIWAAAGGIAMAAWSAGAGRRGASAPWGLRPAVSAGAVVVLLALLVWFAVELVTAAGQAGLAERVFGAAQALWPLAVVASCRYAAWAAARRGPARAAGTMPERGRTSRTQLALRDLRLLDSSLADAARWAGVTVSDLDTNPARTEPDRVRRPGRPG